jgi:hypothetical protein
MPASRISLHTGWQQYKSSPKTAGFSLEYHSLCVFNRLFAAFLPQSYLSCPSPFPANSGTSGSAAAGLPGFAAAAHTAS